MAGTTVSADDLGALIQAATEAANAAAEATKALKAQQSSRSSFQEASKVVRLPEPFGSENHEDDLARWQDFQVNFRAWLYYGNPLFEQDLHRTELHGANPIPAVSGEPDEVQQRCKQLYSILTGLLRGKPLRLLRQVTERNGFEVWRQLIQLYLPKTKSRSISLLSALMNIPNFTTKDRTLLDQILGLERLRSEYVRASGTDLDDNIMLSVLVRALPKGIQQHIQLQMSENSTYSQIRDLVLSYETVTTTWSPGKIHNELGILPQQHPVQPSYTGVAPMEIDRFEKGGKKGKSKGKSKGKDTSKGKSKGKNDKGKGKGVGKDTSKRVATQNDQCLHCGKYGHFKRDCWKLNGKPGASRVNQVSDETQSVAGSAAPSTAPTSLPSSASAVRLFSAMASPVIEELCSEDSDFELRDLTAYDTGGNINMVSHAEVSFDDNLCMADTAYMERFVHFDISYSDDDDSWTVCNSPSFDLLSSDVCISDEVDCIRAIGSTSPTPVEVVLDSGADGSVLPLEYAHIGLHDESFHKDSAYVDAQGKPINVRGARIAEVQLGSVRFKERFIIAAVTSPLISMGRLLKDGWCLENNGGTMKLVRAGRSIPVHFKRNSLCAHGSIRMLNVVDDSSTPTAQECKEHVRALALSEPLSSLGRGWIQLSENVYALRSISPQHVDTTFCVSDALLWLRTTLVKHDDDTWHLDEFCENISEMDSRVSPIESAKKVVEVITIAHTEFVPPEALGFSVYDDAFVPALSSSFRASASSSSAPSSSAPRPAADASAAPDPVPAAADEQELPVADREVGVEVREVLIDGVKLDSNSSLNTLRGACDALGLSKGGGKVKLLQRLWEHLQAQELIAAHSAERNLQGEQMRPAIGQPVPAEPTETQRAQHNLVHYPYAAWCELCVANHARQDDMNLNHMSTQVTVVFLSTLAMLHETMMVTKFVHFSCMTGTLVPCIRCLHPRKVDVGSTTYARSFAGSYFGLVMKQFH